MKVYLAGPDVFLPEAAAILRRKAEICNESGLVPLSPLDSEVVPDGASASEIFRGNCALMDRADAVLANLTPFRGLSLDAGVAFEVGYMAARRKLVCGYGNVGAAYFERVVKSFGGAGEQDSLGRLVAGDGLAIENFGLADNLMIIEAIRESGGFLVLPEGAGDPSDIAALNQFAACVRRLAATWAKADRRLAARP